MYAEFLFMNSNLKMTVERSKRRSYFLSLVFITKSLFHCIFFWRVKNLIVAMLVHLNEQQRNRTRLKKWLRRNYCLSGYQVSLRFFSICLERYSESFLHQKINSLSKKTPALWTLKICINSSLFDAQNAGNLISKLLDFNFFWGSMPHTPLGERGLTAPLVVTATFNTFCGRL